MIEGSWEVTTRILWALVLAMLVLVGGFALCAILFQAAALLRRPHPESVDLFCAATGLLAFALTGALLAEATRYPTENDHDVRLAMSGRFLMVRVLQSAAVANLFRWVFAPAVRFLLVSSGEVFPPVAVPLVFWLSWTAALAAVNAGCTRMTSAAAGPVVALAVLLLCASMPGAYGSIGWAVEACLAVCVPLAFLLHRRKRFGAEPAS